MLNFHRESQRHIHSFKSSKKNVKHGAFTIDFQCEREWNDHIKNKYHDLEKIDQMTQSIEARVTSKSFGLMHNTRYHNIHIRTWLFKRISQIE